MLLKWTQEAKNPLEGWPLDALMAVLGAFGLWVVNKLTGAG